MHGTAATLHFCDQLNEIYGSEDPNVSIGASFAIEHWATPASGTARHGLQDVRRAPRFSAQFWRAFLGAQLSDAASTLDGYNARNDGADKVPLGFWRFHQALEAQHAAHTMDELEEAYAAGHVTDEAKFEEGANDLDACLGTASSRPASAPTPTTRTSSARRAHTRPTSHPDAPRLERVAARRRET